MIINLTRTELRDQPINTISQRGNVLGNYVGIYNIWYMCHSEGLLTNYHYCSELDFVLWHFNYSFHQSILMFFRASSLIVRRYIQSDLAKNELKFIKNKWPYFCVANRTIARWIFVTTTTRILQFVVLLSNRTIVTVWTSARLTN